MKSFAFVVVLAALVAIAYALPKPEDKKEDKDDKTYTNKYDSVNINQILSNDRLLSNYLKCLNDEGNCTPDGAELKKTLPDALNTDCSKCTAVQKEKAEVVIRFLAKNKKDEWVKLTTKYDPSGEHKKQWSKFAEEKGIEV